MKKLYIFKDGSPSGPFGTDVLCQEIQTGRLSLSSLAWHEGLPAWTELHNIPELLTAVMPSPPGGTKAKQIISPPSIQNQPPELTSRSQAQPAGSGSPPNQATAVNPVRKQFKSGDDIIRYVVGDSVSYQLFPCRFAWKEGLESSQQLIVPLIWVTFLLPAPAFLGVFGILPSLVGLAILLCLLFLKLAALQHWLKGNRHRPDALVLTKQSLFVITGVLEDVKSKTHTFDNAEKWGWDEITRAKFESHKSRISFFHGSTQFIAMCSGFRFWTKKGTDYYRQNVLSLAELRSLFPDIS